MNYASMYRSNTYNHRHIRHNQPTNSIPTTANTIPSMPINAHFKPVIIHNKNGTQSQAATASYPISSTAPSQHTAPGYISQYHHHPQYQTYQPIHSQTQSVPNNHGMSIENRL